MSKVVKLENGARFNGARMKLTMISEVGLLQSREASLSQCALSSQVRCCRRRCVALARCVVIAGTLQLQGVVASLDCRLVAECVDQSEIGR